VQRLHLTKELLRSKNCYSRFEVNMKKIMIFLLLLVALSLYAQDQYVPLTMDRAESFIHTLIYDRENLDSFLDPIDLEQSNRLRIHYTGVDWKILIGHDIDSAVRDRIKSREISYNIRIRELSQPYSKIVFTTSDSTFKQAFFFKNDKMISPLTYFTRNMYKFESGYVTFYTSDPTLLNNYSMNTVRSFVKAQSQAISQFFTSKDQQEWFTYQEASWRHYYGLRFHPLIYIVCKDTKQVEQITGIETSGMADLSMDAIISTSNSHFHELMHLIMNYNLNPLPLYTHPMLQEGFATCYGGRNGKSADVMLQTAEWLKNMDVLPLDTLYSVVSFQQQDASISYPLSALICHNYINEYGLKSFFKLYRKYSTDEESFSNLHIDPYDVHLDKLLVETSDSLQFVTMNDPTHGVFTQKKGLKPYFSNSKITIWQYVEGLHEIMYYKMNGLGTFLTKPDRSSRSRTAYSYVYESQLYNEKIKGKKYQLEHYLLHIGDDEITLYDLFLNQMIAYYGNAFVPDDQKIKIVDGKTTFYLKLSDSNFAPKFRK